MSVGGARLLLRILLLASVLGISVGCLLGMVPLLFIDRQGHEELKNFFEAMSVPLDPADPASEAVVRVSDAILCARAVRALDEVGTSGSTTSLP